MTSALAPCLALQPQRLACSSNGTALLDPAELQVARIKYEQSNALVNEDQKDLGEAEHQQLEALRQKRWADLITRQCSTVLKSVQSHKVCLAVKILGGKNDICVLVAVFI